MTENKMTLKEYYHTVDRMIDAIQTRDDLANVIEYLLFGYKNGYFAEQRLEDFLESAADFTLKLDQICKNIGTECPEQGSWRWVAEILLAAFEDND